MLWPHSSAVVVNPNHAIARERDRALAERTSPRERAGVLRCVTGAAPPTSFNNRARRTGYTTMLRMRDTQSGVGSYDVAAFWQPSGNYGYGNSGTYGQYGQYPSNGEFGQYPNDGRYGTNQRPVIVARQCPVYGDRAGRGARDDRGVVDGSRVRTRTRRGTSTRHRAMGTATAGINTAARRPEGRYVARLRRRNK